MLVAWKAPVSICIFVAFAFAGLIPPAAGESSAEIQGLSIADRPALAPGDTWKIRYSDGTKAKRKFLREENGILVFEVSQTSPRGDVSPGFLHLNRDLATVRMLDTSGAELQRFEPNSLGLQFPLVVGREWQGRCQRFDEGRDAGTFVGIYKVVGIESVTVPAGTFQTFRVEGQTYEVKAPGRRWRFVHWYAPEVRMEVKLQAMEPDGSPTEFELSEFVPTGQAPPPTSLGKYSKAFLGLWEGYWKEMILATRLTVERIEGDIVTAVYWRGAYIFPGLQEPSQQRIEGRLLDEKTLRFEVWDDANDRWAEATYTMTGDVTLTGTWKSGDIVATALLKKEP
jgi:hypothetical protein